MNPANGPHADDERRHIALGRYGRPEEVAAMVAYLASEEARYITGAAINVDGGSPSSAAMAWALLLSAGLLEVVWAVALKYAAGFTAVWREPDGRERGGDQLRVPGAIAEDAAGWHRLRGVGRNRRPRRGDRGHRRVRREPLGAAHRRAAADRGRHRRSQVDRRLTPIRPDSRHPEGRD